MGVIRIFKAFKGITDNYEGTIKCSKDLNATLNFIKTYQGKGLYRAGKLRVVKDVNWNTWHEIELQVQAQNPITKQVLNVLERITFRIQYYQQTVTQITLSLNAVDSKATFEDFKKDLAKVPNARKAVVAPPTQSAIIDLSGKTMTQALTIFENSVVEFSNSVNQPSFSKVKAIKAAISKRIMVLPPQSKAAFLSHMAKIDMFINAIDMQFSNPALAASVVSYVKTYSPQMLVAIAQMQALCA